MVNYTLIINKNSEINIKTFQHIDLLYKCCLFRKSDNFICQYKWNNIQLNNQLFNVELWGKNIGTKQYINKCYDISDKINKIFYSSIAFVFYDDSNKYFNINIDIWNNFFNTYIKSTSDIDTATNENISNENISNENIANENIANENDSNENDSNENIANENIANENDSNENNDTSNYDNESQNANNDFEYDNDSLINDNDSLNNDFELKELTYESYYFSSDND